MTKNNFVILKLITPGGLIVTVNPETISALKTPILEDGIAAQFVADATGCRVTVERKIMTTASPDCTQKSE